MKINKKNIAISLFLILFGMSAPICASNQQETAKEEAAKEEAQKVVLDAKEKAKELLLAAKEKVESLQEKANEEETAQLPQ